MPTVRRVVDNRIFLLGLDELYRDTVKPHERDELRRCAKRVAEVLQVSPADVPVEGYYAEDEDLSEYFRLVRALQEESGARRPEVDTLAEFDRLSDITSSPIYGRPSGGGGLLPAGRDALSQALADSGPRWSLDRLVGVAHDIARDTDDISLVGLAARIKDDVVLTATRESVVLYAEVLERAAFESLPYDYVWAVDDDLALQAMKFIDTFNALFDDDLPAPEPHEAEGFWHAH